MKYFFIVAGTVLCTVCGARGQGLMNIGRIGADLGEDFRLPFSMTISSAIGWDSNPRAGYIDNQGTGPDGVEPDGSGSSFWQNSISLQYPIGRGRNRLDIAADLSTIWYMDPPPGTEEFQPTGGIHLDYFRQMSQRLSAGASGYFSYQTQPNFEVGSSINRPTGGYFNWSGTLWTKYQWTSRLSTLSSYTVSGIEYDDDALQSENNIQHLFSTKLQYALTAKTQAALDYRFLVSRFFDNEAADSTSHFLLLGVDRPLGRFVKMSASGGVEFRSYDGPLGDRTEPYAEAAISYQARRYTTFRLYYRGGLEDTGSAGVQSSFAHRVGLSVTQRLAQGLTAHGSVNYVSSDYGSGGTGVPDRDEDTLHLSVGLNYTRRLWRRVYLNAGYTFSMVSSDDPFSEYDRHFVTLGLSARF